MEAVFDHGMYELGLSIVVLFVYVGHPPTRPPPILMFILCQEYLFHGYLLCSVGSGRCMHMPVHWQSCKDAVGQPYICCAWNVHASAVCSMLTSEIDIMSEALDFMLASLIPLKLAPSPDTVKRDIASLQVFASTADPGALKGFDISWSSHAGFPCSRGITKLLSVVPMSQLLSGILSRDEGALETSMVFLVFRRSKMQRLEEPVIAMNKYQTVKIQSTKPIACRTGSYGNLATKSFPSLYQPDARSSQTAVKELS